MPLSNNIWIQTFEMILSTSTGAARGHPEICFSIDDAVAELSQWLLDYLNSQLAIDVQFRALQKLQVGWMLVELRSCESGNLELWEPDFDSIPIRWCRGVNNSVRHLAIQRWVCDAAGCEPDFPTLRHAGIVSPNFTQSLEISLSRDPSAALDSGWVLAELGYNGSEGSFMSLYEIALAQPKVIPYLGLPEGASVTLQKGTVEINIGSKTVTSDDCELLKRLANEPLLI
jgi:hypothetical protein